MAATAPLTLESFAQRAFDVACVTVGRGMGLVALVAIVWVMYRGNEWLVRRITAKPTNWWAVGVCSSVLFVEFAHGLEFLLRMLHGLGFLWAATTIFPDMK